jgi:hypothetical protein
MKRTLMVAVGAALALFGMGLIGCGETPLESAPAPSLADGWADPPGSLAVVEAVCGSGHFISEGDGTDRTCTFNILKHSDGTIRGWYHALGRGPGGAHVRVRIECLHVVGNEAWAAGTVVAAASPDNIGRPYSLRFIDNGEGEGASPDEIGVGRFVESDCTTEPDLALRQLRMGNLQIHH